jgi:hypothetical protein
MMKLLGTLAMVVATIAFGAPASAAEAPKSPVKVPATAQWLGVSRQLGGKTPTFQIIRSAQKVRRIARTIDAAAPYDPPETYWDPCEDIPRFPGEQRPRRVEVRMKFRAYKGAPLLAEATMRMPPRSCEPMSLKVPGSPRVLLEEGVTVVERLHH